MSDYLGMTFDEIKAAKTKEWRESEEYTQIEADHEQAKQAHESAAANYRAALDEDYPSYFPPTHNIRGKTTYKRSIDEIYDFLNNDFNGFFKDKIPY